MLYDVAIRLFSERGYEATTMRAIAREADVSPGLLYRYFPSKPAVVMALYDALSLQFERDAASVDAGDWFSRVDGTLALSLRGLGPHRSTLRAVLPPMLADPEVGLFSPAGSIGRSRVQGLFVKAVEDASNAPDGDVARVVGRLWDMLQLGVILWWLLDRSPNQRATAGLRALITSSGPAMSAALWMPGVASVLEKLDGLIREALYGEVLPSP